MSYFTVAEKSVPPVHHSIWSSIAIGSFLSLVTVNLLAFSSTWFATVYYHTAVDLLH